MHTTELAKKNFIQIKNKYQEIKSYLIIKIILDEKIKLRSVSLNQRTFKNLARRHSRFMQRALVVSFSKNSFNGPRARPQPRACRMNQDE